MKAKRFSLTYKLIKFMARDYIKLMQEIKGIDNGLGVRTVCAIIKSFYYEFD